MIIEENKSNIGIKKNIFMVKSNKLFKSPHQNAFQTLNINQMNQNKTIYNKYSKLIYLKKNENYKINSIEINKNNNINNNFIRKKLLSKMFNKLIDRKYKSKKDDFIANSFKTRNIIEESNNLIKNYKIEKYQNEYLNKKFNAYNNIPFIKYDKEILEKSKTSKNQCKKKLEFKTILIKKNLSTYYNKNTARDLNIKNNEENIIFSSQNSQIFSNNSINAQNRRKINSLCQTKLSIFDMSDEKEKENKKEKIINKINKSVLPSICINKKKVYDLMNKRINQEINRKNNYIFKINNLMNRNSLSIDIHSNKNKKILSKLLNNNNISNRINDKRKPKNKNPICLVNNYYLCL